MNFINPYHFDLGSYLETVDQSMKHKNIATYFHFYLLSALMVACANPEPNNEVISVGGSNDILDQVPRECLSQVICQGTIARYCVGSSNETTINCSASGRQCLPDLGCVTCVPDELSCMGQQVMACSSDGFRQTPVMTCERECYLGTCTDPCERAVAERSYQGCEYWPTPLSNSVAEQFNFAIGVVNVNDQPVNLSIRRGMQSIEQRVIAPRALETIILPWIDALSYSGTVNYNNVQGSSRVSQGAYQVTTDLPVTVYQFNPLEYRQEGNCVEDDQNPNDGACFSYSNDASLLLPTHALGNDYLVLSYPSLTLNFPNERATLTNPSTFQVVGASSGETEVEITFSAATSASYQGDLAAYQAGQTATLRIQQGEVLQFCAAPSAQCNNPVVIDADRQHCKVGREGDLTGTLIKASKPIEVFGSHTCAFIPYNVFACDHLEESIFPLSAWGRNAVVTKIKPLLDEPSLVRIISGSDQNRITFDPPNTHPMATLNRGEFIEFEARSGFVVSGSKGLQVTQFLVGQNYSARATRDGFGDPAISLIPPSDQFRKDYTVLAPETYAVHFLNIVHEAGSTVTLNGMPLNSGTPIGSSNWREITVEVEGGVHTLEGDQSFGVWVYGFGNYTSYMYPGGLDLRVINDVE